MKMADARARSCAVPSGQLLAMFEVLPATCSARVLHGAGLCVLEALVLFAGGQ